MKWGIKKRNDARQSRRKNAVESCFCERERNGGGIHFWKMPKTNEPKRNAFGMKGAEAENGTSRRNGGNQMAKVATNQRKLGANLDKGREGKELSKGGDRGYLQRIYAIHKTDHPCPIALPSGRNLKEKCRIGRRERKAKSAELDSDEAGGREEAGETDEEELVGETEGGGKGGTKAAWRGP